MGILYRPTKVSFYLFSLASFFINIVSIVDELIINSKYDLIKLIWKNDAIYN